LEEGNPQALEELRSFITLATNANRPIVLYDMLERFAQRPYGWSGDEVLILVARLLILQEIQLIILRDSKPRDAGRAFRPKSFVVTPQVSPIRAAYPDCYHHQMTVGEQLAANYLGGADLRSPDLPCGMTVR
jgi:hypothetical protein